MRRVWGWLTDHQFLAAIVLFSLVVAGAFARDAYREVEKDRIRAEQQADRDRFVACMAGWADASSTRASVLDTARTGRDDAADALWRDFNAQLSGSRDVERFTRMLDTYVRVSDELKAARERNPIPDPPRIRC